MAPRVGPLRQLMLRTEPNHLDELRITNCKLNSFFIDELLDTCMHDNCQIRKLGLVDIGMVITSAEKVIQLLNCNQNIIDLDISYNHLTPNIMFKLAE